METQISALVKKVKEKKELRDVSDSVVREVLDKYLKKNLNFKKEKEIKLVVKEVRNALRNYTGRFQVNSDYGKRLAMLENGKVKELLMTHSSTKERLDFYPEIIKKIKDISPRSILDLGCGLNPIAISAPGIEYYAYDIKEDELKLLEVFFKKNKIPGKTFLEDIRKADFPKTDLCIIFKVLDIIETKGHREATGIMKKIDAEHIIVSFATRTLSGKMMDNPRRIWFERLLGALNLEFEVLRSSNEIFYFTRKQ